jgi:MFS family permease
MTATQNQELSEAARERIYRRNFAFLLLDNVMFNIAIGIIGATTLIPDFVRQLTDSEILIGIFGSLFTVGNTLPQLFVARYIVRVARKKWWFIGPSIPVRMTMLVFAGITLWLGKDQKELILLALLVCYGLMSFGDGLVGVPWADITGTSLNNRWRARMFGFTTATTGVTMLLIAPLIAHILGSQPFPNNYALLFALSGVLFSSSILPQVFIHELPGGKAQDKIPPLREFGAQLLGVLREDRPFRLLIVARMCTTLFLMASPFYIGYATIDLGLSSEVAVPVLLAMQMAGSVAGSLTYTWLGARNNLLYMRLSIGGALLLPVSALLAGVFGEQMLYFGFLMFGLSTSNLISAFLNWTVGYVDADRRPTYVGLGNTVTALASLLAPFLAGTIAQTLGYLPLFAVSLLMGMIALYVVTRYLKNTHSATG